MHIDWTITIDGIITIGMVFFGGITTLILMRQDISEIKSDIANLHEAMEEIPTTLARHDERIKTIEYRQNERVVREKRNSAI